MKCCLSCSDKSFGLCCHFDVAYRVEKCDKKSQNIEVADTKGSHP